MTRQEQALFKLAYMEIKSKVQDVKQDYLWKQYIEEKDSVKLSLGISIKTLSEVIKMLDERINELLPDKGTSKTCK